MRDPRRDPQKGDKVFKKDKRSGQWIWREVVHVGMTQESYVEYCPVHYWPCGMDGFEVHTNLKTWRGWAKNASLKPGGE